MMTPWMTRRSAPLVAVALALVLATPLAAEDYEIDAVHSSVVFKIVHANTSEFFGRFNDVSGGLTFDEKNLKECRIRAVVRTASVDTNSGDRDQHVRSEDFLSAEAHPEIVFEGTGFKKGKEKDSYSVKGKLSFRGVTKDLEVTVKKVGTGEFPPGVKRIGFSCTFTVKRTEFGNNTMTNMLSDEVEITVGIEAKLPKKE